MIINRLNQLSRRRRKKERGVALIVVLWVLAALSVMIASFMTIVRTNIQVANAEMKEVQFNILLEAGLELTAFNLLNEKTKAGWSNPDEIQKAEFLEQQINIEVTDPNGLIDINRTDLEILQNLLNRFSKVPNQVETIVNEIKARRLEANPKQQDPQAKARQAALKSISRKGPEEILTFMDLSQLNTLPGMTPDLFRKVKPFLTVHSFDGFINPAAAPSEVLQAIPGVTRLTAEDLVKRRKGSPGDQKIFSDFISRFSKYAKVSKQRIYIIYVSARWNQSQLQLGRRYVIGLNLNRDRPYHMLSWSAYRT